MKLDLPGLESWLWEAAWVNRGPVDSPKFKDYILPLILLKRISDVFEDEVRDMEAEKGSNKERDIRTAFVEADLIEAVVLLPENLSYNTTAPGIILVLNRGKPHPGQILLVNENRLGMNANLMECGGKRSATPLSLCAERSRCSL